MKRYFQIHLQGSMIAEIEISTGQLFHLASSINDVLRRMGLAREDVYISSTDTRLLSHD